jgi:hypothetical protein
VSGHSAAAVAPGADARDAHAASVPESSTGRLVLIAAPPGTGKSTALPHVRALAHGRAVVADIDEALEDGALLGVQITDPTAAPFWPEYDRLWARFSAFVTGAGFPMLLFTQVPDATPQDAEGTVLLGWEVDDAVREARLHVRGESETTIADARQDARTLRELLPSGRLVHTDGALSPTQCAERIWDAARPYLMGSA